MHKVQGLNDGSTITTQEDGTRHLVVADGVRSIQSLRFSFHKLTSVVLPSTLQTIGGSAFRINRLTAGGDPRRGSRRLAATRFASTSSPR